MRYGSDDVCAYFAVAYIISAVFRGVSGGKLCVAQQIPNRRFDNHHHRRRRRRRFASDTLFVMIAITRYGPCIIIA